MTLTVLMAAGAILGLGSGVLLERHHLCTMGAVADVVLFGGWRRARAFASTLAITALLLHVGVLGGFVVTDILMWPSASLLAVLAGGLAFGTGMVLAGGCASRLVVRAASGNGKAAMALLALAAGSALTLALVPLGETTTVGADFPAISMIVIIVALAVLVGSAVDWLRGGGKRTHHGAAVALGVLVALALWLTALSGSAVPVNYVPAGHFAVDSNGETSGFLVAMILGTLVGSGTSAWLAGRWRLEGFELDEDLRRHLCGGLSMGIGGALAGGCTLGAGIGGTAMAAPAAWLALGGMVAGAAGMLHVLASGGWQPAVRSLWSRP